MSGSFVTSPLVALIVGSAVIVGVSQVLDRLAGGVAGDETGSVESARPSLEEPSTRTETEPPRPTPILVERNSPDESQLAGGARPPVAAETIDEAQVASQITPITPAEPAASEASERDATVAEMPRFEAPAQDEAAHDAQALAAQREADETRKAEAARQAEEEARKAQEAAQRRPNLRVYVQADVDDRAGLGQYTATAYAALLRERLLTVARRQLGAPAVTDGDDATFRSLLRDGRGGIGRLCEQAGSVRLLLADVIAANPGFSSIDSAFWPGVVFTAINCDDGRLHKSQQQRLEPQRGDAFEYEQHFVRAAEQFVASQGYFLEP